MPPLFYLPSRAAEITRNDAPFLKNYPHPIPKLSPAGRCAAHIFCYNYYIPRARIRVCRADGLYRSAAAVQASARTLAIPFGQNLLSADGDIPRHSTKEEKMKTRRLLAAFTVLLAIALVVASMAVTAFAYSVNVKISDVELTIAAPVAGADVTRDYSSVTVKNPMDYKVVGITWYHYGFDDHVGVDAGTEKYFIGGRSYTVRIDLQVKGMSEWNFTWAGESTDYSGITATINGESARVTYRELNPDSKTISVLCDFHNIPKKSVRPSVFIPTPVAGETAPSHTAIIPLNDRATFVSSLDHGWYTLDNGEWRSMGASEKFVAGESYKVKLSLIANEGFRFATENADENNCIGGNVNGKKVSIKLTYMGENNDGAVYHDTRVDIEYEFASIDAKIIDEVSFDGISIPSEGQNPIFTAPTMGDSIYSLVTDEAVTGGAQYGFVGGIRWANLIGEALDESYVFENGISYDLTFFIRSTSDYRFGDVVSATANEGDVEITPIFGDPTLAMVNISFAPCNGGVLSSIALRGDVQPINGNKPNFTNFAGGHGFDLAPVGDAVVWYDVTADEIMETEDKFVYGHTYELRIVVASDKYLNGNAGKFELAPADQLSVKVGGFDAVSVSAYGTADEKDMAQVTLRFDCAKALIESVYIGMDEPVEGSFPGNKITLDRDWYSVEKFYFVDNDTDEEWDPLDRFVAGKNYGVYINLVAKEGYEFDSVVYATINGSEIYSYTDGEGRLIAYTSFYPTELPYSIVTFSPGEGDGASIEERVKLGVITLPDCEFTAPEGKKFAGWTTDGGMTLLAGAYNVTTEGGVTFEAYYVDENDHKHVYADEYDHNEFEHYKYCQDPECPAYEESKQFISGHDWGNNTPCDDTCTVCGYVRDNYLGSSDLHFYEFACSEVCPNCGLERETIHTPGAPANCTDDQECTVCHKLLDTAKGHTPGEAATCGKAQTCTVCGDELAPATGNHTPGDPATCTEAQTCTVCGAELDAKKGHTPGEAATCGADQTCTVCGDVLAEATGIHTPGAAATCTEAQTCTVCGAELAPANGHEGGVEWISDEAGHHKLCGCGERVDEGEHSDADGDEKCDVCGYNMSKGLGGGWIALIVIGSVLLLGGGGFCLFWFVIRKKISVGASSDAAE